MISAFGVEDNRLSKADGTPYVPGSITYHQEQADLHARKKSAAGRRIGYGTATAGAGLAGAAAAHRYAFDVADHLHGNPSRPNQSVLQAASKMRRFGVPAGLGVAGVGAGLATEGFVNRARHGRKQNASIQAAQAARRTRNASKDRSP